MLADPLAIRILEGLVFSNRHWKTPLGKMIDLLDGIKPNASYYFVADAYYAAKAMVHGLGERKSDIITRVKKNAIAFLLYVHEGPRKRGRPRFYGDRVVLAVLLRDDARVEKIASPVYCEWNVIIEYVSMDLLWKSTGTPLRFVAVRHPMRGLCILMCRDLAPSPAEIIRVYGLRFKIEFSFWMKNMSPQNRAVAISIFIVSRSNTAMP